MDFGEIAASCLEPVEYCSLPTARACRAFARIRNNPPLTTRGSIDVRPEGSRTAVDHVLEGGADHGPRTRVVPRTAMICQYLLDTRLVVHLNLSYLPVLRSRWRRADRRSSSRQ